MVLIHQKIVSVNPNGKAIEKVKFIPLDDVKISGNNSKNHLLECEIMVK